MNIDRVGQRIAREYVQKAIGPETVQLRGVGADSPQANGSRKVDGVSLSPQGRELQRLRQIVNEAPDVREDRVAEIKRQTDNGTYQISIQALAHKLAWIANGE